MADDSRSDGLSAFCRRVGKGVDLGLYIFAKRVVAGLGAGFRVRRERPLPPTRHERHVRIVDL